MKDIRLACFVLGGLLLQAGCEKSPQATDNEEAECLTVSLDDVLLPLAKGNYWTSEQITYYRGEREDNGRDTGKIVIEKMMTIQHEGQTYQVGVKNLHFPPDKPSTVESLRWNGADGLYRMGVMAPNDTILMKVLRYKYPVQIGERWRVPHLKYLWQDEMWVITDTFTVTCVATNEIFQTALDTFRCVVYHS